jgi:hypothetical protein
LFYQLVEAAAEEVLEIAPKQANSVNHWRSQVSSALYAAHGNIEWRHFMANIDGHTFEYLRLHSEITALVIKKSTTDFALLESAKKSLLDAINEISESSASSLVKISLIKRIISVVNAIDDFQITGDERVFDEFKATLFDLSKAKDNMNDMPGKSKIRDGLAIISDLMSTADGAIALSGPIVKLLENFA